MLDWHTGAIVVGAILIVALLIAFVASRSEGKGVASAWDASFAIPKILTETAAGIYLGVAEDGPKKPLHYGGDRHIMTIGPNGSGKSMRLLYKNLHDGLKGWSVVVVDPKGDLANLTHNKRKADGSRTIVLDPFGVSDFASRGCNPLRMLDPVNRSTEFPDETLALAEAVIRLEGREPHWAASAQDLICACIMQVRLNDPQNGSFADVRDIIGKDTDSFRNVIGAMTAMADAADMPELGVKAARFADINEESRELHSILSTALTQTRWLDSRPIKADLKSEATIDFAQLKETPTTVYLVLPPRYLTTHAVWLRLMITTILTPLMRDTKPAKVPVLLMLDEYPALAEGDGFPVIARNMAMFRGYGVKLWTVWQDLNQALRIYGQHWESFASNAGVLQAFQPQDVETAKYLSERTGTTVREMTNWSFSGRQPSMSGNQHGMPLMLPQGLRRMGSDHTLVFTHMADGPVRAYLEFPELPKNQSPSPAPVPVARPQLSSV
jgi:type IV secretion system protein VirD4